MARIRLVGQELAAWTGWAHRDRFQCSLPGSACIRLARRRDSSRRARRLLLGRVQRSTPVPGFCESRVATRRRSGLCGLGLLFRWAQSGRGTSPFSLSWLPHGRTGAGGRRLRSSLAAQIRRQFIRANAPARTSTISDPVADALTCVEAQRSNVLLAQARGLPARPRWACAVWASRQQVETDRRDSRIEITSVPCAGKSASMESYIRAHTLVCGTRWCPRRVAGPGTRNKTLRQPQACAGLRPEVA